MMVSTFVRVMVASLVLLASPAGGFANGEIMVMNAMVQPPLVPNAKVGALFFAVMNHGAAADRLIGIESSFAEKVELHESKEENGIAKMRPVEAIDVPAGATVELKPGGFHAMLKGVKAPLEKGTKVAFTLKFEKAGTVPMEATVGDLAAIHNHGATTAQ